MAEDLCISNGSKEEKYRTLLPQIKCLIADENDLIANLANVAAALKETFGFFWVGFYLVKSEQELTLGPFQGSIACYRIRKGRGVCGTAWEKACPLIVPDVDLFPGHIACSSESRSEIVIPIIYNKVIKGVLDIGSDKADSFDETDRKGLEEMVNLMAATLYR
mgnify:CR=1 FL=1